MSLMPSLRRALAILVLALPLCLPAAAAAQLLIDPRSAATGSNNNNSSNNSTSSAETNQAAAIATSQQQQNPFIGSQPTAGSRLDDPSNRTFTRQQIQQAATTADAEDPLRRRSADLAKPGEFEQFVTRLLGRRLRRFGDDLLLPGNRDFAAPATATVPPDYIIQPGDMLQLGTSGSLEGAATLEVDTSGRIFISGVGTVRVAGVRNANLRDRLAAAIGTRFRNFTVSVVVRELRGIRVYVTGLAARPGAFTVSSLSTAANAVFQAGGPAPGGSFRAVKIYRNSREIGSFDLYDLLRGGRRVTDIVLQNEDVLFIPPAGEQVAVIGSVQQEAIYELLPGESLAAAVTAAGGPNTLADRSRLILYRAADFQQPGAREILASAAERLPARGGDVIQLLSQGSLIAPTATQAVLVRIEGEVHQPGNYYLPAGSSVGDLVQVAGGLSERAYAFGTRFTRQAIRLQQQENYREALRQLEFALGAAPLTAQAGLSQGDQEAQLRAARTLLEQLRQAEPDGRIVLDLNPQSDRLPGSIVLESNDAVFVPPQTAAIGVFGAVYRPSSFLIDRDRPLRVRDYVDQAGGTLRAADRANTIVVRANGSVLSRRTGALRATVVAGDVIFVPIRTQANLFWAHFRDISQAVLGIGLTVAAASAVVK